VEGLDGVQKMSKSLGNYIGVAESPQEMFGKAMSIPDVLMEKYFTLLTDVEEAEIKKLLAGHPRDAKVALAKSLVRDYHGLDAAEHAIEEFNRIFKEGGLPDEIPVVEIPTDALRDGGILLPNAMAKAGLCSSSSEARRLIQGGGAKLDGDRVSDPKLVLSSGTFLLQAGKRKVARVTVP
jgi:tyrosyl-tRNA synthetase